MERDDSVMNRRFRGIEGSVEAKKFLSDLEEHMRFYGYVPSEMVEMVVQRLEDDAAWWWSMVNQRASQYMVGDECDVFKRAFLETYAPKLGIEGESSRIPKDPIRRRKDKQTSGGTEETSEITGWVKICGQAALACFDTGSNSSVLSVNFVAKAELPMEREEDETELVYGNGSCNKVQGVCKHCCVVVGTIITSSTFVVAPITSYDVILGMDWLGSYYAHIDCNRKCVVFKFPGTEEYVYHCRGGVQ